jgi:hypothetical protein
MQCKNVECGEEFKQTRANKAFCSKRCYTRYWTIRTKARREREQEENIQKRIQEAMKQKNVNA